MSKYFIENFSLFHNNLKILDFIKSNKNKQTIHFKYKDGLDLTMKYNGCELAYEFINYILIKNNINLKSKYNVKKEICEIILQKN